MFKAAVSNLKSASETLVSTVYNTVARCVGRGMANHNLAVGVYAQSLWWTYAKSLKDSESVEKATSSFLGAEQYTNYDSKKSHFDKTIGCRPGVR